MLTRNRPHGKKRKQRRSYAGQINARSEMLGDVACLRSFLEITYHHPHNQLVLERFSGSPTVFLFNGDEEVWHLKTGFPFSDELHFV